MPATVNKKEIDFSIDDDQSLLEAFLDVCRIDGAHAAKGITVAQRRKIGFETKRSKLEEKIRKRKSILLEQERRLNAKREELRRAQDRVSASADAYTNLTVELRRTNSELDNLNVRNDLHAVKLTHLNEIYSQESQMGSRVRMLGFIGDYIDKRFPVKYELVTKPNGAYDQHLYWVTKRNHVSFSDSSFEHGIIHHRSLTEFGPFIVHVARYQDSIGSSHCNVTVNLIDPEKAPDEYERITKPENGHKPIYEQECWSFDEKPFAVSEGYVHPHVSAEGSVCTGNSKEDILLNMKNSDYSMVIQSVMMVLTQYNHEDPYRNLSYFERYPQPNDNGVCACGKLELLCDCTKSTVSLEVVDESFLSPCGCTYSECLEHHEKHNSTSGINGTGCFPKRTSRTYKVFAQSLESPGVPVQLNEINNAITALCSGGLSGWVSAQKNKQQENL